MTDMVQKKCIYNCTQEYFIKKLNLDEFRLPSKYEIVVTELVYNKCY